MGTSKTRTTTPTSEVEDLRALLTMGTALLMRLEGETETAPAVESKKAPRKRKTAAQKRSQKFYDEVIVGGREKREARKASNAEQAAWMRSKGLIAGGPAWDAVSRGERKLTVLRPLDKAHRADLAERKAARKA